ncbi:hypothetical protein OG883_38765 [Streptomyces sp. NBC_01142]|uniref:hypothetical protein n=1 Tax=Streptomyces sp. NBC_01142 TaxID=2975865 RepID=UPI00224E7FEA|nr:hypothetical protein [Streptomyces sp. NBC_01142]MCX4825687.1 hypothetical protein [Streptomyces sp. NBC_01142]
MAAAATTSLALIGQIAWLDRYSSQRDEADRRDPLAERLAQADLHPALAELAARDPEAAARLWTSRMRTSRMRTSRGRNRGRPRRRNIHAGAGE